MFPVEVRVPERDEDALTAKMAAMREWLDHRRLELSTFRYTFTYPGILFRVDFGIETDAASFAKEFGGRLIAETAEIFSQTRESTAYVDHE